VRQLAALTIEHNFETAHRLPFLPGKCQNIHGHSWKVKLYFEGVLDENGIVEGIEFGQLKKVCREWIDKYLDHGAMLGWDDPLRTAFLMDGSKVFWFGEQFDLHPNDQKPGWAELPWPTVEAVAIMLGWKLGEVIENYFPNKAFGISTVMLQETDVNGVEYSAQGPL